MALYPAMIQKVFDEDLWKETYTEELFSKEEDWQRVEKNLSKKLNELVKETNIAEKNYYEKYVIDQYQKNNISYDDKEIKQKVQMFLANDNYDNEFLKEISDKRQIQQQKNEEKQRINTKLVQDINQIVSINNDLNNLIKGDNNIYLKNVAPNDLSNTLERVKQTLIDTQNSVKKHYKKLIQQLYDKDLNLIYDDDEINQKVNEITYTNDVSSIKRKYESIERDINNNELIPINVKINNILKLANKYYQLSNKNYDEQQIRQLIIEKCTSGSSVKDALTNLDNEYKRYEDKIEKINLKEEYKNIKGNDYNENEYNSIINGKKGREKNQLIRNAINQIHIDKNNNNELIKSCIKQIFNKITNNVEISEENINKSFNYFSEDNANKKLNEVEQILNNYLEKSEKVNKVINKINFVSDMNLSNYEFVERCDFSLKQIYYYYEIYSEQLIILKYGYYHFKKVADSNDINFINSILTDLNNKAFNFDFDTMDLNDDEEKDILGHKIINDKINFDFDDFIAARNYVKKLFGNDYEKIKVKKRFDDAFFKCISENDDIKLLKHYCQIEFDEKNDINSDEINQLINELSSRTNNELNEHKLYLAKEELKLNNTSFKKYLNAEIKYLDYSKYLPKSYPKYFKDYLLKFNLNLGKGIKTINNELDKLTPKFNKISVDVKLQKKLEEYNNLLNDDEEKLTIEKLIFAYNDNNSTTMINRIDRLINSKKNSTDSLKQLENVINNVWRKYFEKDSRTASQWSTDFNSNYEAKIAIEKFAKIYEFYTRVHPNEEINLKKFIGQYDNQNEAKNYLQNYYDTNIKKYKDWLIDDYLKQLINNNGSDLNYLFGLFNGDIQKCKVYLEGRKSLNKYNEYLNHDVSKQINPDQWKKEYFTKENDEERNKLINDIQSKTEKIEKSKYNWKHNPDYVKASKLNDELPLNIKVNLPNDYLTMTEDENYNKVLLEVLRRKFQYDFNINYDENKSFNEDMTNNEKFNKMLSDYNLKLKEKQNWDNFNISSYINQAENYLNRSINITEDDLRSKYKDANDAIKHIDVLVKERELMNLKGIINDQIPKDEYPDYYNLTSNDSKIEYLNSKIEEFKKDREEKWGSNEFSKIINTFAYYFPDDERCSIDYCIKHYKNDYKKAKLDLQLETAKKTYSNEFNEEYPNKNKKQGQELIYEIHILMENYFKLKDDEIISKLIERNQYVSPNITIRDLVNTFGSDKGTCKLQLEHDIYVGRIKELTNKDVSKNYNISEQGNYELKKEFDRTTNQIICFDSSEFANVLEEYNQICNDSLTIETAKSKFDNDYNNAYESLKIDTLKTKLKEQYHQNVDKINNDKDLRKVRQQLDEKLRQVQINVESILNNHFLIDAYYKYCQITNTNLEFKYFIYDNNCDTEQIEHIILKTIWENYTDTNYNSKESLHHQNVDLFKKIQNWNQREVLFSKDSDILKLIKDPNNTKITPKDLLLKYKDSLDPNKDVINARIYLDAEVKSNYYKTFSERLYDKNLNIDKLSDDVKVSKMTSKMNDYESFQQFCSSNDMPNIIKQYNENHSEKPYEDWIDLYNEFKGDKSKAKEKLQLSNLKHEFKILFGEDYKSHSYSGDKSSQIDDLQTLINNYKNYYDESELEKALKNYNEQFSKNTTKQSIVREYENNASRAINSLKYEVAKAKLNQLYGKNEANKYSATNDDLAMMKIEIEKGEKNKKEFEEDTNIDTLIGEYNSLAPVEQKLTRKDVYDKWNKHSDAVNWLKILIIKYKLKNDYGININEREFKNETSSNILANLTIKKDRIDNQWEILNKIDGINDIVNNYLGSDNKLETIFAENNFDAYQTYLDLLCKEYNQIVEPINPKKVKDYSNRNLISACKELLNEINNVIKIVDEYNKTENNKWDDLTRETKNEIITKYKDTKEGFLKIKINDEIVKYNSKNVRPFNFDNKLKEFKQEGRDINNIYEYITTANNYDFNDELTNAVIEYNSNQENEEVKINTMKTKFDNAYEVWKYITLEPLRRRYKKAFKKETTINIMMDDELRFVIDNNNKFDFNRAKFISEARILYKEYVNANKIKDENNGDLDNYCLANSITSKELLNAEVEKWRVEVKNLTLTNNQQLDQNLAEVNKQLEGRKQISKSILEEYTSNKDDIEVIKEIIKSIPFYEKHFNTTINPNDLTQLLNDPKNPDWINAYLKIKILPLLDDYNEMAKLLKTLQPKQLSELIPPDKTIPSLEKANELYEQYKKVINEEKIEYLKDYYKKFQQDAESIETLQEIIESQPDIKETEKYLRLKPLVVVLNKKYRELKTFYKKNFEEIDYKKAYGNKNIENLKLAEDELNMKIKEADKLLLEEKKKDEEAKRKIEIDKSKLTNSGYYSSMRAQNLLQKGLISNNKVNNNTNNVNNKVNNKPPINEAAVNKTRELIDNYEGGISALISQSKKGISIRQLLLDQQRKNRLANKGRDIYNSIDNGLGRIETSFSKQSFNEKNENKNDYNLFSSKEDIMSGLKPISQEGTATTNKLNHQPKFLPTPVDQKEVVKTGTSTQILPKRTKKNAPLRYKYLNNSLTKISNNAISIKEQDTQPKSIRTKIKTNIKLDNDEEEVKQQPIMKEKSTFDKQDISLVDLKNKRRRRNVPLRFKQSKKKSTTKKKKNDEVDNVVVPTTNEEINVINQIPINRDQSQIPYQFRQPDSNSVPKPIQKVIQQPIQEINQQQTQQAITNNEIPSVIKENPELMRYFNLYNNPQ